jgi:hypothetical protein
MTLRHLLAGAAAVAILLGPVAASADTVIGTEDPSAGFVGDLFAGAFGPNSPYQVASDGESGFDPFGAGHDTSDGLNFSAVPFVWNQAADSFWENIGFQTWDLPAALGPCGNENEPICEPSGHFISPTPWTPGAIGTWLILDATGGLSDKIITWNDGGGNANLRFFSDPTFSVPEPATWAMMLIGFFGLGATIRARKTVAA